MTQKTTLANGLVDNVVYQDNHLVYDKMGRLRAVFDGRTDVRITYDMAGNRTQVKTHVINSIYDAATNSYKDKTNTSTTQYSYDAMNRQNKSWEAFTDGITTTTTTHVYEYDLAGNRWHDETYNGGTSLDALGTRKTNYRYLYDDLHRIESYTGEGANDRMEIKYDGAGRQVYSRSQVSQIPTTRNEYRYNQYDATGKLQDTRVVLRVADSGNQRTQRTDVAYHDSNGVTGLGYDAAGNLKGYRQVTDGNQGQAATTRYGYQFIAGSYQQASATTQQGNTQATTNTWRDANGYISNITQDGAEGRFNRAFVNDAQGNAVYLNQGAGSGQGMGRIQNVPMGYLGGYIGNAANPGHIQRQLVVNGEVMARYGESADKEKPAGVPSDIPTYGNTAEFKLGATPIRPKGTSLDAISYTVAGGETLKQIARNLLGDAGLWWRIAEANGLAVSGDGQLTPGQTLSVPKLALNANNVDTFQPYDPSQITGSTDPVLPVPQGNGGGCGGLGKIIMVAVAVVATMFTAGAAAALVGGANFSAAMGAGLAAATGGGLAGVGAGAMAIGGAVGSIASQAVGNLIGAQDGFSWKSVALSAIGGGISGGMGGMDFGLGQTGNVIARAAVGNALGQGIGVVTGLQSSFSRHTGAERRAVPLAGGRGQPGAGRIP